MTVHTSGRLIREICMCPQQVEKNNPPPTIIPDTTDIKIFCRLDSVINYTFLQIKHFLWKNGVIIMTQTIYFSGYNNLRNRKIGKKQAKYQS